MCVNYRPATPAQLHTVFKVRPVAENLRYPEESFPGYAAPIILGDQAIKACFGLIAPWAKDTKLARSTYNARSETVAQKPSFRQAWRRSQFCFVPMQAFFEPNYEGGAAVRWCISRIDTQPFAVAGLWEQWLAPNKALIHSFTMLTVNADGHPLMQQFHKPGDEKRTIAILDPEHWEAWQQASPQQALALLKGPDPEAFTARPLPLPPRAKVMATKLFPHTEPRP
jgi:putative SOS response-associated peptidase YedK